MQLARVFHLIASKVRSHKVLDMPQAVQVMCRSAQPTVNQWLQPNLYASASLLPGCTVACTCFTAHAALTWPPTTLSHCLSALLTLSLGVISLGVISWGVSLSNLNLEASVANLNLGVTNWHRWDFW